MKNAVKYALPLTCLLAAGTVLAVNFPIASSNAEDAPKAEAQKPVTAASAVPAAKPEKDYTIVKLGSEDIKNSEVLEVWKGLFPAGSAPDFSSFDENVRQNVLRGMVSEKLIVTEAKKSGFDKSAEVKKRLEQLQNQVVMQAFMENKAKSLVTDEQLKKAYDAKIVGLKDQEELKARHILVKEEDEAKKLSKEIKKGGDFDKLAKEKSIDKATGAKGGDLGWFTKDKMVPEFADAAFKLKAGEVSEPVKSSFGWHIIKAEERRKVTPPSFEEMQESLRAELANDAVRNYVEELLKSADIKYYGPDGKERSFSRSFEQPKADAAPAAGDAAR